MESSQPLSPRRRIVNDIELGSSTTTGDHDDDDVEDEELNQRREDETPAPEQLRDYPPKSFLTRLFCCLCLSGCCYNKKGRHCCGKWCRGTRNMMFGIFLSILLFATTVAASISYAVYVFRSAEEGTIVLNFFNTTYVTEYFVGNKDDSLAYEIRLWAVNLIITQTASIALLSIAVVFASFNLIRRIVLCPKQDKPWPVVLGLVILGGLLSAAIIVSNTRQDNRVLVEQTNDLASTIDDYTKWFTGAPGSAGGTSGPASPSNTTVPTASGNASGEYQGTLTRLSSDFMSTLFSKLPENIRIYALLILMCLLTLFNIFR